MDSTPIIQKLLEAIIENNKSNKIDTDCYEQKLGALAEDVKKELIKAEIENYNPITDLLKDEAKLKELANASLTDDDIKKVKFAIYFMMILRYRRDYNTTDEFINFYKKYQDLFSEDKEYKIFAHLTNLVNEVLAENDQDRLEMIKNSYAIVDDFWFNKGVVNLYGAAVVFYFENNLEALFNNDKILSDTKATTNNIQNIINKSAKEIVKDAIFKMEQHIIGKDDNPKLYYKYRLIYGKLLALDGSYNKANIEIKKAAPGIRLDYAANRRTVEIAQALDFVRNIHYYENSHKQLKHLEEIEQAIITERAKTLTLVSAISSGIGFVSSGVAVFKAGQTPNEIIRLLLLLGGFFILIMSVIMVAMYSYICFKVKSRDKLVIFILGIIFLIVSLGLIACGAFFEAWNIL